MLLTSMFVPKMAYPFQCLPKTSTGRPSVVAKTLRPPSIERSPMAADESSGQGNKQQGGIWPTAAGETEPGGLVPPYEGRTGAKGESGEISDELSETVERQMADSDPGNVGAIKSPANESPVGADEVSHGASGGGTATATDPTATSAHGVGESVGRRGEDVTKG